MCRLVCLFATDCFRCVLLKRCPDTVVTYDQSNVEFYDLKVGTVSIFNVQPFARQLHSLQWWGKTVAVAGAAHSDQCFLMSWTPNPRSPSWRHFKQPMTFLTPNLFFIFFCLHLPRSCWCSLCRTPPSHWCRVWRTLTRNTPVCHFWLRRRTLYAARWSSQVPDCPPANCRYHVCLIWMQTWS